MISALVVSVALGLATAPASASLQAGDRVRVQLPGTDLDGHEAIVSLEGTLALGAYGEVAVAGHTLAAARLVVREHLRPTIHVLDGLDLSVVGRGITLTVTGMVAAPGRHVVGASDDVWHAIAKAGGPRAGADLSAVRIQRGPGAVTVDLEAYLSGASLDPLPRLAVGDRLFVPAKRSALSGPPTADDPTPEGLDGQVFVLGAVQRPGLYRRPAPLHPWILMGMAGGALPDADLGHVRVISHDEVQVVDLREWLEEGAAAPALELRGVHTVVVPDRRNVVDRELVAGINVIGGVAKPGRTAIDGRLPLEDAIALAGGPATEGDLSQITLVRRSRGATLSLTYDLTDRLDEAAAPVWVEPGDTIIVGLRSEHPVEVALRSLSQIAIVASLATVVLGFIPGI